MHSSYVFLVSILVFILNYVTRARGPQFYHKLREVGMLCKKGQLIRDDDACATCVCMFRGVIRCFRSKCHDRPKGHAVAHALAKPIQQENNADRIVKVQGCTPGAEQFIETCVTCKCINSEEMSCVKMKPCDAITPLASLDYLFGDVDDGVN